ncbi:MAG: tetratricopeptide repeat protein, partial [Planctomycetota bacterium]
RLLCDAYEKTGELDKARKEIERTIAAEPRDVRNHATLATLLWKQEHKDDAIAQLQRAIEINPGYEYLWNLLRSYCEDTGKAPIVLEVAQKLVKEHPKDVRGWMQLAHCYSERDNVGDAMRALDTAIQLNPKNVDAHSQKALQLSQAGQFDQAIAACKPAAFADKQPLQLQSREAWIEGERGNITTAVFKMRAVVEQDADYYWAWHRLAEWYEYLDQRDNLFEASQQMVRLEPTNPVPYGYLGDIELRRGNRVSAKKHFRQAVQIAPAYSFATNILMDLYTQDQEYDQAMEIVQLTQPHVTTAWFIADKLRIESLRGDKNAALGLLRQLAVTPADDVQAIDAAVESLFHAGWSNDVLPIINELLNQPNAQPGVAYVYVHLSTTLDRYDECEQQLSVLESRPELWEEGAAKYVEELGGEDEQKRLKKYLKRKQNKFRDFGKLWNAVGRAYNSAGMYKESLAWMADWKQAPDLKPEYTFTITRALWQLDRHTRAAELHGYTLSNCQPDYTIPGHLTMLAYYEFIWGEPGDCIELIGMIDQQMLSGLYLIVYQHLVTVLEALNVGTAFPATKRSLEDLWNQIGPEMQSVPLVKRIAKRVKVRAATLHGAHLAAWKFRLFG